MKMYITMCGQKQAMSLSGIEYGWPSTMYTTTEEFFPDDVFDEVRRLWSEGKNAE